MRTVAGQVFLLQLAIVVVLAATAVTALILQSRADNDRQARGRAVAVAQTYANSPGLAAALASPDPTARLQHSATQAARRANVDSIVVLSPGGVRYTHPRADRIGTRYMGDLEPALSGGVVIDRVTGSIGPIVRALVPVQDPDGTVVGLVAVGITVTHVPDVAAEQLPLLLGVTVAMALLTGAGSLLLNNRLRRQTHGLGPAEMTRMYEHHDAVLHAVREGVLIVGGDGRLLLVNDEARRLFDLPPGSEGRHVEDVGLAPETVRLLASGRTADDEVHAVGDRLLALSQRPTDRDGDPPGSVTTVRDTTELQAVSGRADLARGRLKLLYDAGAEVGTTLDMRRTCEELSEFAAARFADHVSVDLVEAVLSGEEPVAGAGAYVMRRVATSDPEGETPMRRPGSALQFGPDSELGRAIVNGRAQLRETLDDDQEWREMDPRRGAAMVEWGFHSMISVPLRARGIVLGVAIFWRSQRPEPFESDDLSLAEELVARAAVSIDNARRYTREHTMAVTLQRSLLPHSLPDQNALDVAYRYLPTQEGSGGGVGGDWFDVIPLPGTRVALAVGDVVGHGLHAAATMGRLRTALHNFSSLDLPPDEVLWRLDELVTRLDQDEPGDGAGVQVSGATCVYAIYDPVTGQCAMARAGHLLPAVVHPDGTAFFAEVPGAPPLGLGGLPFETLEVTLPPGSQLVLYTDGLVEDRARDIDEGLETLRATLAGQAGHAPEEVCEQTLRALLPERPRDDIAILVGRTRRLTAENVADWDVPTDPSAVAGVRSAVAERLAGWGLGDDAFTTELILSELVTNAIRYAAGPIHVRLIRDRTLICEVSDHSSTSPHLRQAASTDEGGRGLFLVSQFAVRWGTRYTAHGKVIWTEQPLPDTRPRSPQPADVESGA